MGEREITRAIRRLRPRLRDLRDADRRAPVHRTHRAGHRRQGGDGGAAAAHRCSREPCRPTSRPPCSRRWQKLPADRFGTAEEFADALANPGLLKTTVLSFPCGLKRSSHWPLSVAMGLPQIAVGVAAARLGTASRGEPAPRYVAERLGGPRVAHVSSTLARWQNGRVRRPWRDAEPGRGPERPVRRLEDPHARHDEGACPVVRLDSRRESHYYERFSEVPRGVYSISPVGGDDRLVLPDAGARPPLPDGSLLVWRYFVGERMQLLHYWPESGKARHASGVLHPVGGWTPRGSSFPAGRRPLSWEAPVLTGLSRYGCSSIDLETKRTRCSPTVGRIGHSALAVTPTARRFWWSRPSGMSTAWCPFREMGRLGRRSCFTHLTDPGPLPWDRW